MSEQPKKRLVLIDGHGLAYRMFFAIQAEMSTRAGEPTNATYGFTRMLVNLIAGDNPPDYVAVSFDVGTTFRDALFSEYKATRQKMPDSLHVQIKRIHEVLEAFNIPTLEAEGYEADDVLGTVARLAAQQGLETLIVTGDKDLLQLVDEHTRVQLPGARSGEVEIYDVEAVRRRFGFDPPQIVDFKALVGDKSDNIPGVAGIGEKTATELIQTYGTLDNIYAHLHEIKSARVRSALEAGREMAYLSRDLARIVTDVPLTFNLEACRTQDYDRHKVAAIFRELEFRSLLGLIPTEGEEQPHGAEQATEGAQLPLFENLPTALEAPRETKSRAASVLPTAPPTHTVVVRDEVTLNEVAARLEAAPAIAFDTETTSTDPMRAELVGLSLAVEPGTGYYIPLGHKVDSGQQLPLALVVERLSPAMTNPAIPKYGHNVKYDAIVLARHGLQVSPLRFDTMIGEWLVHPGTQQGKLGLKALAFFRLGVEMTEIEDLLGVGRKQITMDLVPVERVAPYAAADADMTLRLVGPIARDLAANNLMRLFDEIEMPLVPVLIDMEMAGVLIDTDFLRSMAADLNRLLEEYIREIYAIVGYAFNINSTQQLSEALFHKLQLPTQGLRRTQSGHYSTAADVLEALLEVDTTGVVRAILDYREVEKLRSTYVEALPQMVNPTTGRIHTSFNQTGTVTGRISSSEPNLQNIPIRSDLGRRVREAFIAAPGCKLIGADYSQVELRIMAHISGDEGLRQAFWENQDIHASTAAKVFNIPLEAVTPNQRSFAKAVNFGLMYGMSAFRLARDSGLTLPEAESFIRTYFERFPRVREYIEATKRQALERGYVETLLGRRRYFPALQSTDTSSRAMAERRAAEREAINMPIQGTAADIIKIAMVRLHHALRERGLRGRMILQVHDELLLEVPDEEVEETLVLVREVMENAYPLDVPLRADARVGRSWGELK